ncbi:hypothetical protein AB6A40_000605 [Gnathostoma spinigerum]|uniref:Alpha-1,3/1,6-mannosyltransferase ALG2 n=1 Tax=Gnathostoma spinigerum TaxID=75299 RepID=A0ABD6E3N2_9BILA
MLVVILHPEQWNGGSDRCTIAMIRHFVEQKHRVVWFTTMIDKYWNQKYFTDVEIRDANLPLHPGDWFTQNVALGWSLIFSGLEPDLVVVDHSASCVPMIKWRFPKTKVLFYCHFPQQLVTPSRFFLYRWYAYGVSLIEGILFSYADCIMLNSYFTESKFKQVMPEIDESKLMVVYPPCDVDAIRVGDPPTSRLQRPQNERYIFLSMNRFWPEKRLDIIVRAASELKKRGLSPIVQLAGSVMPHIPESKIYYDLLHQMVNDYEISDIVEFIPSPNEVEKFALYRRCDTVLYTPPNEHFGIVPIEALEQRRPVIVCNSGGPSETVIENVTGSKLNDLDECQLADIMERHMKQTSWPSLDDDAQYAFQVIHISLSWKDYPFPSSSL